MNIIFDLDGVLLDSSHRHHLIPTSLDGDWGAYEDAADGDRLIMAGVGVFESLCRYGNTIHIVTERSKQGALNGIHLLEEFFGIGVHYASYRTNGCTLHSVELKRRTLAEIVDKHGPVDLAFEDDPEVAAMYREHGITTYLTEDAAHVAVQMKIDAL